MEGKESKLTEKPDGEIITSPQLSVPEEDLRHKNPENYLEPALKMVSDFYHQRKLTYHPKKILHRLIIK